MSDGTSGRFYRLALRKHGEGARAVGWRNRRAQRRRFRVIDRALELDGARLLDVGCGLGAFNAWLRERGRRVEYVGIDPVAAMVEAARRLEPDAEFHETSLETAHETGLFAERSFDYAVASGIFSRRQHCDAAFLARIAEMMFRVSRRGVVLNSLSTRAPGTEHRGWRIDPAVALPRLLAITPDMTMHHDPAIGDVTFVLRRITE